MIAMPKLKECLSPAIVYPTAASIDRSIVLKSKKKKKVSMLEEYQDALSKKGDSTIHSSIGDIHIVRRKASISILCTLVTKLRRGKKYVFRLL